MASVAPRTNGPGSLRDERWFGRLAALLALLFVAYASAAMSPAPSAALSIARNVFVLPIPVVVWWAYRRSPAALRRPWLFFSIAANVWLAGTVVWYVEFFAGGETVPEPPGPADGFFLSSRLLIIAGIVSALRTAIPVRIAALDAAVILSAGFALGAALVGHHVSEGFSVSTLLTLNGPVLGLVTLILIVSAAVGSWQAVSRFFVLLGAGIAALTAGTFIYSYHAVRGTYVDDRWPGVFWSAAAVLIILAASVVIFGVDRPVRLFPRAAIPGYPPGANAVLFLFAGALSLTLGVAFYGDLSGMRHVTSIGVGTSVAVGLAMALRAREAIRTAEDAYARLDHALAAAERSHDQLVAANEELHRTNVRLQTTQIALAEALNLADERSQGRLRELIEDTGEELARMLEDELGYR